MNYIRKALLLFFLLLFTSPIEAQAIRDYLDLVNVIVYEKTGTVAAHSYNKNDSRLSQRFGAGLGPGNFDFKGSPPEFFDVYYSDDNGNLDSNGEYISVECKFNQTTGGGGLNVTGIGLEFSNGDIWIASNLASFFGDGGNYIAGSEVNTVDCDLNTNSTMGNTSTSSNNLRITVSWKEMLGQVMYMGCQGDSYSIVVGSEVFDEGNPIGVALVPTSFSCDSMYFVELTFEPLETATFTYTGCEGDGFSIEKGGVIFDEFNPSGTVNVPGIIGCDTLYTMLLTFEPEETATFTYTGCEGDGFSIEKGGVVFDELKPSGTVNVPGIIGCDTIYTMI